VITPPSDSEGIRGFSIEQTVDAAIALLDKSDPA
jgi:hypothetical protein